MEYPKIVIVVKTWQGPRERNLAQNRLESAAKMVSSIEQYLHYPNYVWHIADDGSEQWYQEAFLSLFNGRDFTFTSTGANGDIGKNLNKAIKAVLETTDVLLHWSDDIVLESELDIKSSVQLLCGHEDIGIVRLRPSNLRLKACEMERDGEKWHVILPSSSSPFLCITSLILMHRRAWNFYGPYPEGLRIDMMQEEMSWRYRKFEDGPKIVVSDELWHRTEPLCVGTSTWDWRLGDEGEKRSWHRYRSYNARFEHG